MVETRTTRAHWLLVAVAIMLMPALPAWSDDAAGWTYELQRDPIHGGRMGIAQVKAPDALLMTRCSAGFVEVRLFYDLAAGVNRVTWRFDGSRAQSGRWSSSPNGRSLVVPLAARDRFIEALRHYRRLHVELSGDGPTKAIDFSLKGSALALHHALGPCS